MTREAEIKTLIAAEVMPATPPSHARRAYEVAAMYWDVKTVKPLPDYRLYVEIADGRRGIFDVKPYLDHGVFRELRNPDYFKQVDIVFGALTWPHQQDIAPETLLAELVPEVATPTEARQLDTPPAARS